MYPGISVEILPCIISFTVRLSVSDEASAGLVQVLAALCTLEAGCMPLQVGGDSQDVLVVYLTSTAHTHCDSRLLCVRGGGIHKCNSVRSFNTSDIRVKSPSPLLLKERKYCSCTRITTNK